MVFCVKLKKEAEGLNRPPLAGELGKKVLNNISFEAWQLWLGQQTILINEYHLNPLEEQARAFLEKELLSFLFEAEEVGEKDVANEMDEI